MDMNLFIDRLLAAAKDAGITAAEVYTAGTGKADWHNELPKPPFDYDLRSRHAALLGGSGDYLCTKQQELDDITRFMSSWRD